MIVVLMGVTGSGKTTVGRVLASELGWTFYDADDFHPASNIDKMRRGIPLTDEDRKPWLEALARLIDEARDRGENMVLACSALKHAYQEYLRHHLDVGGETRHAFLREAGFYAEESAAPRLVPLAVRDLCRDGFLVPTGCVVVRRSCLDRAGPFDESLRMYEDVDLWIRLLRAAPVAFLPRVLLARRIHPANTGAGRFRHRRNSTSAPPGTIRRFTIGRRKIPKVFG